MDHQPDTHHDHAADPLAELFPGPAHLGRPRRRTARRVVAGGAAVALLALGGAAVAGAGGDDEGGYRTATATTHEVSQVLDRVGTIEPVSQASVAFPVGGTVERVGVEVGDTVIVGQELADLDMTELTRTLHDRQATLAQAELVLQKALDGEDVSSLTGGAGGSGAGGGAAPSGSSSDSAKGISWDTTSSAKAQAQPVALPAASSTTVPTAGSSGTNDAEVRAAQQAVLDAQRAVDRDLAAAQAALDTATEVCAAVGSPTDGPPSTSATSSTTSTTTPATPTASSPDGSGVEACRAALAAVLDAQSQVAADQAAVADASRALDALLADRATSSSTSSGGAGGTGSAPSGSSAGSSTGTGGTPSSSSTPSTGTGTGTATASTASSEDLVAYQKAVDAAAAQLASAEQAIDQARIVSPIAGTVVSVGLAVGDEVSAGSATAAVVVAGAGGFEVTTHVSVDDVPDLEVGQTATVVPDGGTTAVRGEVVRIGAADTSSGSASYPVTIGLAGDTGGLGNGSVASVEIVTDAATRALAVPVSAVTVVGDRHTVTVLDGTTTRTVEVEVGAVGQRWVEVTDGLDAGDEVVLADLSQALPSSATEAREQQQGGSGPSIRFGPDGGSFTPPQGFSSGRPPGN